MFNTQEENEKIRLQVDPKSCNHEDYLLCKKSIILAGFYNPLTATGGIGTVMKMIGADLGIIKVVCVESSSLNKGLNYTFAGHRVYPLCLTEMLTEYFHRKFCKEYFWPLLHEENTYTDNLNQNIINSIYDFSCIYAEHLLKVINDCPNETIIWFNDYAMIPVLSEIRKKITKNIRIGISIRSSFGVTCVPKLIPVVKQVIQDSLLAANFVSFHRQRDVYHFLEFMEDCPSIKILWEQSLIETKKHLVVPRAVPMGSSPEYWSLAGKSSEAHEQFELLQKCFVGETIILSVSRLEPHKGIEFELDVIERLLKYYPNIQGKFRFIRIMPVFKEYKDLPIYNLLKKRIDQRVLEINQLFSDDFWQPIELLSGISICHNQLAGYYRAASILMVLSYADGFNHVSVESVLTKQKNDPPLNLLLSDTGSSDYLNGAFIRADSRSSVEVAMKLYHILTSDNIWRYNLYTDYFKAASARTSLDWAYEIIAGIAGIKEK